MLEVNAIDLHYGAAQALRSVSINAAVGNAASSFFSTGTDSPVIVA